jgi:hypothetical protein
VPSGTVSVMLAVSTRNAGLTMVIAVATI